MRNFFLLLLMLPFLTMAQNKGINFEHDSTWEQVKQKAKTKNKFIFVDCYTTWCGPCKYMTSTIFPQENVGNFFNANFVNLKIQIDQTKSDNAKVKAWYSEAKRFAKEYNINVYPTFLIFSPDGELVHRIIGISQTGEQFIERAKLGLNPETQLVTLIKKFDSSPEDAVLALKVAKRAKQEYDVNLLDRALSRYLKLAGIDSLLTSGNIELLIETTKTSKSPSYKLILDNKTKVDELLVTSLYKTDDVLKMALYNEYLKPLMDSDKTPDFDALGKTLETEHPEVDMGSNITYFRIGYYAFHKNWTAYCDAVTQDLQSNTEGMNDPERLNSFAWTLFEGTDDPLCLKQAIAWSKKSLEKDENVAYLDTYANLLYKTGDKEGAILWQSKAVEKAPENQKAEIIATLEKMKKGEATWDK